MNKKIFVHEINGQKYVGDPFRISTRAQFYDGDLQRDIKLLKLKGVEAADAFCRILGNARMALEMPEVEQENGNTTGWTDEEVWSIWLAYGEWCNKKKENINGVPTSSPSATTPQKKKGAVRGKPVLASISTDKELKPESPSPLPSV